MPTSMLTEEIANRKTFAIISHPDSGKTTMTEKLLLLGGAIQLAGTVKGKKSGRMVTSDWMKMEQERGISITTSVMQFFYQNYMLNLLDTPGHEDFSEDTYRTLTAVDSALMMIDAAKGVEIRTIKLMEVCRLRDTPIFTFINKMDREVRDPVDLIDEVESVLNITCAPITWPIGMGKSFKGVYHLLSDTLVCYQSGQGHKIATENIIEGIASDAAKKLLGPDYETFKEEIDLILGACPPFDLKAYQQGQLTPVFFGTALGNFGIKEMMDCFIQWAPSPLPRQTNNRLVVPEEDMFSGFVFKIQANMDPKHRDRIAFMRICSGRYIRNMKMHHVRLNKDIKIADAVTFLAGDRTHIEEAVAGDIIGLHNHGTIQIGDTFTQREHFKFIGIPNFAPELFKRVQLKDPLKLKQLKTGLQQLSEEGATQLFMPLHNNDLILGAVGTLQFDTVLHRLAYEYRVDALYEPVNIKMSRWITCDNLNQLTEFKKKYYQYLALDNAGNLTYLAPTTVNLSLAQDNWPDVTFHHTREH